MNGENEVPIFNEVEILHTKPEAWERDVKEGWPPLYASRTFEFHPEDRRDGGVITITLKVRETEVMKDWELIGPDEKCGTFVPGDYTLIFKRNSPQQLISLKIDPDPGGGRVP